MANPYAPPNPAATGESLAGDVALAEPRRSDAPRWLAVLLAFCVGIQLLGLGLLIVGRPRRAAVWLGIGLGVWAMMIAGVRLNVPVLTVGALPGLLIAWVGSVVATGRASFGRRLSSGMAVGAAVAVFVIGSVGAMAQRRFLTEAFQIPSGAMIPTLLVGDHIFVSKGSRSEPGDVIVFKYPPDPEVDYIFRVIGRGGEIIEVRADVLFLNGKELPQTRLTEPCPPEPGRDTAGCLIFEERNGSRRYRIQHEAGPTSFGPVTIPAGHLFVMGDNRHNSNDSRVWGTVPAELVKGRARFVWSSRLGGEWRWGRIGKRID